jgi:hypothetical protein
MNKDVMMPKISTKNYIKHKNIKILKHNYRENYIPQQDVKIFSSVKKINNTPNGN